MCVSNMFQLAPLLLAWGHPPFRNMALGWGFYFLFLQIWLINTGCFISFRVRVS